MSNLITFNDEKRNIIARTVAKALNPTQFAAFIEVAMSRGLDPLMGQIHASTHGGQMTLIVGIDGFRSIAHRTGDYAGRSECHFEYDDNGTPVKAKVTVYRIVQGTRCEFTATAKWAEYYPGDKKGFMWRKMPETMLEKCCEAKALRMAFPSDLSGFYAPEEMDQAGPREVQETFEAPKQNHEQLVQAFMGLRVSKQDILNRYELNDINDLSADNVSELREIYQAIANGQHAKTEFFVGGE